MSMSSASTIFLSGGGGSLPLRRGGASVGRSRPGGSAGALVDAPVTTPALASGSFAGGSPLPRNPDMSGGGGGMARGFDAPPFGGSAIDDLAQYTLVRAMRLVGFMGLALVLLSAVPAGA